MLDVLTVRPKISKIRQKAVYVTEENVKEFLEFAFPGVFKLDTLGIDKSDDPYIYAYVKYRDCYVIGERKQEYFTLNKWYVNSQHDAEAWNVVYYFEDEYEIESDSVRRDE